MRIFLIFLPIFIAWTDEQITFNQVSDFKDSQENKILDTECLQKIWSPTLMVFHRSKKSTYSKLLAASRHKLNESAPNNVSNTSFILRVKESWDLWCKMDFSSFPIDTQVSKYVSMYHKAIVQTNEKTNGGIFHAWTNWLRIIAVLAFEYKHCKL